MTRATAWLDTGEVSTMKAMPSTARVMIAEPEIDVMVMRLSLSHVRSRTAAALAAGAVLVGCTTGTPQTDAAGGQPVAAAAAPSVAATSPVPRATGAGTTGTPTPESAEDASPRGRQLVEAAGLGDTPAVRRLLAGGADVRARDDRGRTALIAAAYGNHVDAARALVEAGADVNAKDPTQQSAYLIATSEVGDDPRLLELTLTTGADVQAKDSYNGTGLIRAGERGYPRIVDRLLRAGVEVDHVNRLGWTALLEAIILGEGGPQHVATVRLLLAGGANPDLPDRDKVTPLAHAERRGQQQIIDLLRAAGARS